MTVIVSAVEPEPQMPPESVNQVSPDRKKVLLVDGTALAYQSFFALQNLRSPAGLPTGAVYGFYQTVQSLLEDYHPDYVAVVMDLGTPEERTEAFSDYKADRPPTPPDLLEQLPVIEELMTVMGIPVLAIEGIEADDILATLAVRAKEADLETYIFSPDKDMLQVVGDLVRVIRRHGSNTKIYDRSEVVKRYGVSPDQFADLLGLMGDKVDNIPGVPGIGEKTASSLLKEYGSLEKVLDHAGGIRRPKLRENLLKYREQAILSRDLAILNQEVPMDTSLEDLVPSSPDWEKALLLFEKLGFKRAAQEALQHVGDSARRVGNEMERDYRLIQDETGLEELAESLKELDRFAVDTETTGVDPHSAGLVGICVGASGGRGWYLPISHKEGKNLRIETVRNVLGPLFENPELGKLGHHVKFDARILQRHGFKIEGWQGDTMVLAHLLHSRTESLKLDSLARQYLDRRMTPIHELIGGDKKTQVTMDFVDVNRAAEYGAEDAEVTVALHEVLEKELDRQGVRTWYQEVEVPLTLVLGEMEARGVCIDPEILRKQSEEVRKIAEKIEQELFELAGREFNPNSPKQLAAILFDERGVPPGKNRSTRQEVLEDLARSGEPLAAKIIEYRRLTKLRSTYLEALPEMIHPCDGRVHTSYNPTIANTGRISSNNPNLQNIPIRTDLGRKVREAFIADEGCVFVSADYSQIELRVLAHFSGDPGFRRAFREGRDIHRFTASELFGVSPEEVDKEMRRKAKEINFGLNYGMSSFGLATRLNISRTEAREYMDRYFSRYPKIREYFDQVLDQAEKMGYVTTLAGRRIEVPRPTSRTGREARAAINAPIQGSAADILKKAMVDLRAELKARGMKSAMVLTVHDEIILETPQEETETVVEMLPRVMVGAFDLSVPIEVDVNIGNSWADLG